MGDHTDYSDGFSQPIAIDLGIAVAFRPSTDNRLVATAENLQASVDIELSRQALVEQPVWVQMIGGCLLLLAETGADVRGGEFYVKGNLSVHGGLSSSAALCTASTLTISAATQFSIDPLACAQLCQQVEHQFVNVRCGILDQMACGMCDATGALRVDFRDLSTRHVPMAFADLDILVVECGVVRSLHQSGYNERRGQCEKAVELLNDQGCNLHTLRDANLQLIDAHADLLGDVLVRRARHVVTENARVDDCCDAFVNNDHARIGEIMLASHLSLQNDYEATVPELDRIAQLAADMDTAIGGRVTGAGFGGNAVVVCQAGTGEQVGAQIVRQLEQEFSGAPSFQVIGRPNPATTVL